MKKQLPRLNDVTTQVFKRVRVCRHGFPCSTCCWLISSKQKGVVSVKYRGKSVRAHVAVFKAFGRGGDDFDSRVHSAVRECGKYKCMNPSHMKRYRMRTILRRKRTCRVGEENHKSKLSVKQVVEIRDRYFSAGGPGYKKLAEEYGVFASTIKAVVERKTWNHVP